MNIRDLIHRLPEMNARGPVTVEFVQGVEDLECYPEMGMRATLVSIVEDRGDSDVLLLRVNYETYDEFNKPFESHNYFDRAGQPVLTAREAGFYHVEETIYMMATDKMDKYFRILDNGSNALYTAYRLAAPGISYTLWLENLVHDHALAS